MKPVARRRQEVSREEQVSWMTYFTKHFGTDIYFHSSSAEASNPTRVITFHGDFMMLRSVDEDFTCSLEFDQDSTQFIVDNDGEQYG
jgi:hypothetical protein